VIYAPFTAPRDLRNFGRVVLLARKVLAENTFSQVISTGSSPAVAFLPRASMKGIPSFYIESAARADGPSMTGKIISRFRRINTFCQYPAWADERWQYRGSVFDTFESGPTSEVTPRRAVVSVGTQEGYPFLRLFKAVVPLLADFDEVLYQVGDADVSSLGITGVHSVPHEDLKKAIAQADVVISHAGVGGALTALSMGKHPIMIPRSVEHGEHIDDHQIQVARELDRRGLATLRFADDLTADDLVQASRQSVVTIDPPPFNLTPRVAQHEPRRR
jgi:UDP-N-acetylglucosamine transferase subunit ALG13